MWSRYASIRRIKCIKNHIFHCIFCKSNEAREIQQSILAVYEQDFSKPALHEVVPRIRMR